MPAKPYASDGETSRNSSHTGVACVVARAVVVVVAAAAAASRDTFFADGFFLAGAMV
jgi:hypothetical protein